MAVKYENNCQQCATPLYPCHGVLCELRHEKCYYCDSCKKRCDRIYYYEGGEYCLDCIEKRLEVVE